MGEGDPLTPGAEGGSTTGGQPPSRTAPGWIARGLAAVASGCHRRAPAVALGALALFALSVVAVRTWLEFMPDRYSLLGPRDPLRASLASVEREFPYPDDMVVVLVGSTAQERQSAVRELARRLEAEPRAFRDVFWGLELPSLREGALFYLERERLERLLQDVRRLLPALEVLSGADSLATLLEGIRTRLLPLGASQPATLGLLDSLFAELLRSVTTRGRFQYRSPWGEQIPEPETETPMGTLDTATFVLYNTREEGHTHLLLVKPASSDWTDIRASVGRLREVLAEFHRIHPVIQFRLTGEQVLLVDEVDTALEDSGRSAVLTLVAVSILVVLCFGEVRRPLITMAAVVLAVGWTLGFTAVALGHVNLITVWVATLLVVLAADFGVHLVYRYEEERCSGRGSEEAMRVAMATAGRENLVGGLATGATFYSLLLTDFQGLHELAIIAGTGTLLCFLAMSTALPALIFLQERHGSPSRIRHHENEDLIRLERWCLRHPVAVAAAFALLSLGMLAPLERLPSGYSLLDLQDPTLESVRTARELDQPGGRSILFGISLAPDLASVDAWTARFEALDTVHHVESVAPLFPRDVEPKARLIQEIRTLVTRVGAPTLSTLQGRVELERTAREFVAMEEALARSEPELLRSDDPEVRQAIRSLRATFGKLEDALLSVGPGPIEDALESFRLKLLLDVQRSVGLLKTQKMTRPLTLEDLPRALRVRSVGRSGTVLLRVYPKEEMSDGNALRRFVEDLRTVDPEVTGPPVVLYHFASGIMGAYRQSSLVGLLTIALIALVHFRSLLRAVLSLVPLGLGVAGMLGLLSALGQPLNMVDFLALPLLVALGSVLGIHVVDRFVEHGGEGLFVVSTGPAAGIAALTTLCGFVILASSRHQGIASLGLAMTGGLLAATLGALVLLPALVKLLRSGGFRV